MRILPKKKREIRIRVAALVQDERDRILFVKQAKGRSSYWLLPGGGVEYSETAEEALQRELQEEFFLKVQKLSFLLLNESIDPNGKKHIVQLVFKAEIGDQNPILNANDRTLKDYGFFSKQEIQRMDIRPNIKSYLMEGSFSGATHLVSTWVRE